ncbi:MAG: hypothetical protein LUE29_14025 [Lachnospiraceae bacterium]|nr:hypothetical protein [Lachnospiraceae bacterium]
MKRIISNIRIVFCSAAVSVRKMFKNVTFWLLIVYALMFWFLYALGVRQLAAEYDYGVTPFLLPLFFSDGIYGMYGKLMLCLVTCNAPFLDRQSMFTLQRTGCTAWSIGQMIYIVLANIIFMAIMMATQVIFLFPHLTISDKWGSVLYTIANLPEVISDYGGYGYINGSMILGMEATTALTMQLVLCVLLGSVVGAVIFLINGLTHSGFGGIFAVGCMILTNWLSEIALDRGLDFDKLFLFRWLNIGDYMSGTYDFVTNVLLLVLMFLALAVLSCVCVKKRWIRTTE